MSRHDAQRLAGLVAGLAIAAGSEAQQFGATAIGSLTANAVTNQQTYGPGPITSTTTRVSAVSFSGGAAADATLTASALDMSVFSTINGSASASVTLMLQAPTDAGARIRIVGFSQPFAVGSFSATILGNTHFPDPSGVIEVDARTPPGGLAVDVRCSVSGGGFYAHNLDVTTTWSYPGVTLTGTPTPGCLGDAVAWTRGIPLLGDSAFGFTCTNAHPFLGGVTIIGLGGLSTPVVYDLVNIWIDPNLPIATLYLPSNASGGIFHPLPLPSHSSYLGLALYAQFALFEPSGCTPLNLSGSNAIRVVLMQ